MFSTRSVIAFWFDICFNKARVAYIKHRRNENSLVFLVAQSKLPSDDDDVITNSSGGEKTSKVNTLPTVALGEFSFCAKIRGSTKLREAFGKQLGLHIQFTFAEV